MSLKELMRNPLSEITEQVYLTGVTGVTRPDLLRSAGITHVLNVAGGELDHLVYRVGESQSGMEGTGSVGGDRGSRSGFKDGHRESSSGFKDVDRDSNSGRTDDPGLIERRENLRDSEDQSLLPNLDELVDFVSEAVRSGGRVVVHCVAGVSRSASVVLAYLVREHGMTLREAHSHVVSRRHVINPNMGFWVALVEYEMNIRGENSVELLDYVCGRVPSLDSYKREMQLRIKLGWMDHLFFNLAVQIFILITQMVGTLWIFSDYSS